MEWWRQNMKKGGASSVTAEKHSGGLHSKIAAPSMKMGSSFHSKPMAKFADGGMVDEEKLKQEGLASSKDEKVGFFERIKAGNIDDPNSEAYKRFGAGRAKMDRELDAATKEADDLRAKSATKAKDDADFDEVDKSFKTTRAVSGESAKPMTATPAPSKPAAPKKAMEPVGRGVRTKITDTGDETERLARRNPAPRRSTPAAPQVVPGPGGGLLAAAQGAAVAGASRLVDGVRNYKAGSKITYRPADDAPSIYASKEEWAAYRKRQAEKKAAQK